ncbi:MAG: hypothetical protein LH628_03805 [Microcoleus sp. CAN_BIN18]|nr:hypothetical protein [Microcoleus sp. CAN_BIN18]
MSCSLHNITKNHNSSKSVVILGAVRYADREKGSSATDYVTDVMPDARCPMPDAPCPILRQVPKLRSPLGVKICQTFL